LSPESRKEKGRPENRGVLYPMHESAATGIAAAIAAAAAPAIVATAIAAAAPDDDQQNDDPAAVAAAKAVIAHIGTSHEVLAN